MFADDLPTFDISKHEQKSNLRAKKHKSVAADGQKET